MIIYCRNVLPSNIHLCDFQFIFIQKFLLSHCDVSRYKDYSSRVNSWKKIKLLINHSRVLIQITSFQLFPGLLYLHLPGKWTGWWKYSLIYFTYQLPLGNMPNRKCIDLLVQLFIQHTSIYWYLIRLGWTSFRVMKIKQCNKNKRFCSRDTKWCKQIMLTLILPRIVNMLPCLESADFCWVLTLFLFSNCTD